MNDIILNMSNENMNMRTSLERSILFIRRSEMQDFTYEIAPSTSLWMRIARSEVSTT